MALLADGNFYTVTFASPTSGTWQALAPIPGYQTGVLADAVTNGTSLPIYVIDSASGRFSYNGGEAYDFDDTIVSVIAGPFAGYAWTDDDAISTQHWGTDGVSTVYIADPATLFVRSYSGAMVGGLKAFLP